MRVPMPALLLATSLLVTGGAVGSASAHAPAATGHAAAVPAGPAAGQAALAARWSSAPGQAVALPVAVVALAAVLALARARRDRRALGAGLALMLVLLAFETGLHSVHHLAEPGRPCVVAAASAHMAGTVLEAVTVDVPCAATGMSVLLPAPPTPPSRPPAPAPGRAPPA